MSCEVLAPAGSQEALVAAVRSGADAIYMGMGRFNARRNAANFDEQAFLDAVDYCHKRSVRVYLTLNTLVSDNELNDALDCVRVACEAGVDAVIVQDVGLARLIRRAAPELKLHASTQMSVHSPSALGLLKDMGFSRVVLAREMSADEIREVTAAAAELGIEVEVFVHGALCMCLSGQCYLSSVIGQRSGNRGMCAQPCRLAFDDGSYPLSLRDLSLIDYVSELEQMGVCSLKIEGRMKRPEYVAAAVSAFRNACDKNADLLGVNEMLGAVFGRNGHTDGYYRSRLGAEMFGRRTDDEAIASAEVFPRLHELYRGERQSIGITLTLTVRRDEPATLTVSDGENTVTVEGAVAEQAINRPLDRERAEQLCCKLGATPFYAEKFACDIGESLTLSASAVNDLRRRACERLLELRAPKAKPFYKVESAAHTAESGKRVRVYARFACAGQVPDDLSGVDRVYLPLDESFDGVNGVELGAEIPRALFCGEKKIKDKLAALPETVRTALCNNIAAFKLAEDAGLRVHAGFGCNIFNTESADFVSGFAEDVTLSFELTLAQARAIGRGGIIAYGRLPLMLTRNCAHGGKQNCKTCSKELVDRKQARFPVKCGFGFSEVLNCLPVCLDFDTDRLDEYDFIELYFTDESKSRCAEIIRAFADRTQPEGQFTRALYRRGVL